MTRAVTLTPRIRAYKIMVSFICDLCQTTLKKAKVDRHCWSCPSESVSCIDCCVTFYGDDYRKHTQCMTEAEKVEGKLYRGKKSKSKQQQNSSNNNNQSNSNNNNNQSNKQQQPKQESQKKNLKRKEPTTSGDANGSDNNNNSKKQKKAGASTSDKTVQSVVAKILKSKKHVSLAKIRSKVVKKKDKLADAAGDDDKTLDALILQALVKADVTVTTTQ
eukprot:TRINITY_DN66936_c8_g6_i1.p1 TRINITY_DN66936_c8_g6~~TRINITY_DN66936_c8_g6_i1.p1  ORF type:complete len:218 (+),score=110.85 TRINITY_DN66936_c8_g6_i1:83-736(+)